MYQDEQELLSVWEGWHWDDNKGGWLDPELCAKARKEEVECTVATRCTQGSPEKHAGQRPTSGN